MPQFNDYLSVNTTSTGDLLLLLVNPSSSPNTRSITVGNFQKVTRANTLIISYKATPANSTPTIEQGTIFFDDNYLYVATSNNTLKRLSLSAF